MGKTLSHSNARKTTDINAYIMKMVKTLAKLLKMENRCSSPTRGNFSISQPNENVLCAPFCFYMHASMQINNSKYNLSLLTTLFYVP